MDTVSCGERYCQICGRPAALFCDEAVGDHECGIALCDLCGTGHKCLDHAIEGPLAAIRLLLVGVSIPDKPDERLTVKGYKEKQLLGNLLLMGAIRKDSQLAKMFNGRVKPVKTLPTAAKLVLAEQSA